MKKLAVLLLLMTYISSCTKEEKKVATQVKDSKLELVNQNLNDLAASSNYDSSKNAFVTEFTPRANEFELIQILKDPNIGVHWGAIGPDNQALVDRVVNIDSLHPSVQDSHWYLTQWKKSTPLMLNNSRQDFINTDSAYRDGLLGKPKYEVKSPADPKFGVETSLRIFNDPNTNSNVFEITGSNGWINRYGGSNVFLTTDITDQVNNVMTSPIELTFNGKTRALSSNYTDGSAETRNRTVVGQEFLAFYANHASPDGKTDTGMFIQILLGDTRGQNFEYSNCQRHGAGAEIVYSGNLDGSFHGQADAATAGLTPQKYNLNKYLCQALTKNYNCPGDLPQPNFAAMKKDLKNWRITGFYTGVETQAAAESPSSEDESGSLKGQTEVSIQYSNLRISANKNLSYIDCDSVLNSSEQSSMAPADSCHRGSFPSGGQTIDFSCGCGDMPGGHMQADGCYQKVHNASEVAPTPPAPASAKPISHPNCNQGSFKSGADTIEFFCGCGEIAGAHLQADGCYQRVAGTSAPVSVAPMPVPVEAAPVSHPSCNQGSFKSGADTIEFFCGCGEIAGAHLQADGCYQRVAGTSAPVVVAPQPVPVEASPVSHPSCNQGSFKSGADTIEFFCGCGEVAGAHLQADGCYQRVK